MDELWATLAVYACFWLPLVVLLLSFVGLVFGRKRNRQEQQTAETDVAGLMYTRRTALPSLIAAVPAAAIGDGIEWILGIVWPDKRPRCPNCGAKLDSYVVTLGRDKGEKKYLCRACGFDGSAEEIDPGA